MKAEEHAVALCERYSSIPGIRRPYEAGLFTWKQQRYCHVSGLGDDGHRHLVEVFLLRDGMDPQPVLAYQYPPPIAEYFPAEYQLLYDQPCNGENGSGARGQNGRQPDAVPPPSG